MTAYALLKLVHVLAAVLGTGAVSVLALGARSAPAPLLLTVSRWAGAGLGLLLLTGVGLDHFVGGAFHQQLWFRLAGVTLVLIGAVLGYQRRQLKRGQPSRISAWVAFALVGVAVFLMESRSF